jgi:hypothetical protein
MCLDESFRLRLCGAHCRRHFFRKSRQSGVGFEVTLRFETGGPVGFGDGERMRRAFPRLLRQLLQAIRRNAKAA